MPVSAVPVTPNRPLDPNLLIQAGLALQNFFAANNAVIGNGWRKATDAIEMALITDLVESGGTVFGSAPWIAKGWTAAEAARRGISQLMAVSQAMISSKIPTRLTFRPNSDTDQVMSDYGFYALPIHPTKAGQLKMRGTPTCVIPNSLTTLAASGYSGLMADILYTDVAAGLFLPGIYIDAVTNTFEDCCGHSNGPTLTPTHVVPLFPFDIDETYIADYYNEALYMPVKVLDIYQRCMGSALLRPSNSLSDWAANDANFRGAANGTYHLVPAAYDAATGFHYVIALSEDAIGSSVFEITLT